MRGPRTVPACFATLPTSGLGGWVPPASEVVGDSDSGNFNLSTSLVGMQSKLPRPSVASTNARRKLRRIRGAGDARVGASASRSERCRSGRGGSAPPETGANRRVAATTRHLYKDDRRPARKGARRDHARDSRLVGHDRAATRQVRGPVAPLDRQGSYLRRRRPNRAGSNGRGMRSWVIPHRDQAGIRAMSPLRLYEYVAEDFPYSRSIIRPCMEWPMPSTPLSSRTWVDGLSEGLAMPPAPEDVRLRFIHEAAWARHLQPLVDAAVRRRPPSRPREVAVRPRGSHATRSSPRGC
jgi:hypothetical protein